MLPENSSSESGRDNLKSHAFFVAAGGVFRKKQTLGLLRWLNLASRGSYSSASIATFLSRTRLRLHER